MINGLRKLDFDPFGGGQPERASAEERRACIAIALMVIFVVVAPLALHLWWR